MNITPEEAQAALNDIQDASTKARNVANTWAYYMLLWGVIWTIGFLATQFQPHWVAGIWIVMVVIGMAGSAILGITQSGRMRPAPGITHGFHQLTAWHLLRCALLFCHSVADHFSTYPNANRYTLDLSSNVWFYHRWLLDS